MSASASGLMAVPTRWSAAASAAAVEVEGDQLHVGAVALDAPVGDGAEPLEREHLEEEARAPRADRCDRRARGARRAASGTARVRLALEPELVGGLEHRHGMGEPVEVLPDRPEVVDRLGLIDDVQLAAALVELELQVGGRLEPGAEAALGLAHALGHRPHLAVVAGEHADDAVGLAELVGAEHDALVPVQAHRLTVPASLRAQRDRRSGGGRLAGGPPGEADEEQRCREHEGHDHPSGHGEGAVEAERPEDGPPAH